MISDNGNLARLASELTDLRAQLAQSGDRATAAEQERDRLRSQLADETAARQSAEQARDAAVDRANAAEQDAKTALARLTDANENITNTAADVTAWKDAFSRADTDRQAAQARVAELESLYQVAPPSGSGIVKVQHYMTSDKRTFDAFPDAQRHAGKLGLIADLGITDTQAEAILAKGDAVIKHLAVANGDSGETTPAPQG